jgi:hypothetical protein
MQATDSAVNTPEHTILIVSASLLGAAVADKIALFSPKENQISNAHVTLPKNVSGQYLLLIADLTPERRYTVQAGSTRLTKTTGIAGTIHLENISLQSGETITISRN